MASQTNVYVNPPSIVDPTLVPTTQFTVELYVDYVVRLWGYQLTLSFNPAVLHGVSVENGPFLESRGGTAIVAPGPGFNNTAGTLGLFGAALYPIANFPTGGSDEYGPLCTITFEVVGYGSSPIILGPETGLANETGGWIIHKKENPEFFFDSYFNNKPVYVDPPRVRGVPVGEVFTINVTTGNIEDLYSWEFYLNWSAPLLNVTNVVEGDFLKSQPDGTQFYQEIHNDEGYIYVNCTRTGATGVSGSGTLANVTFLVEDNGNSTLHLYDTLLLNSTFTPIPVETVDGWFTNEKHTLTIDSLPISGIEFTLDGTPYTTPFSDDLEEKYYTVVMPETQRVLGKKYGFANWTDGSTNRTRVIDLTTNMSLTANYEILPLPVHNIDIDYDYETIQEAIDAVETLDGHTILVEAGTYYENVLLHKSLKLMGENRSTTIIDGSGLYDAIIYVTADNVTISGFTIQNSSWIGIYLEGSPDSIISGGIISGNNLTSCTEGIGLYYSDNNTISNNLFTSFWYPIWLAPSNNNTIYGNIIDWTFDTGLYFYDAHNNTVVANTISNSGSYAIYIESSNNNTFYHNNFINNTQQVSISLDSLYNAWNSSYPIGGNYWSDYTGIDIYSGPNQDESGSDDIGDTPRVIDTHNNDTYPLMNPWRGHVVIDNAVVSDKRGDVDTQQTISFHAKWSLTGSDVTTGTIYVNGTGYSLNGTGWINLNTPAYDTVGKRLWGVTGVLVEAFLKLNITTYEKAVGDPFIIWDKVNFTLNVADNRINVGDTALITWTGVYEYDNSVFTGTLTFNDTLTKNVVGKYWYTVASISDSTHGLTVFEANSVYCIFDRVQIVLSVGDDRINVGDVAAIFWTGTYEYDSSTFEGSIAYNDTLTQAVVGKYWYTIESITEQEHGITAFASNSVYVIFDRVTITLVVNDDRIDVDSTASIISSGVYQYDNEIYDGTITLNDTLTKSAVGMYCFTAQSISDDSHGITVFESNAVSVIFDKVHITLDIDDNRIDVGTSTTITWTGYYEYDLATFTGTLTFNDTLTKNVVGKYWYTVASISDSTHGLTVFEANSVYCIFDRVAITLSISDNRIDVGSSVDIALIGVYQYDNTNYDGTITLNDTMLSKFTVGRYGYTVSSISGDTHGITAFESNSVYCIFDRVQIVLSVGDDRINVGDVAAIFWTGTYEYDSSTFEGSIAYNDTLTKTVVGKYGYEVESISDIIHGLTAFNTNEVDVIFDRVTVTLSTEDDTIEVDNTASITWTATYQYDGTNFDGTITLNDTLTKSTAGTYYYTTESIGDDTYGITTFESNTIAITFLAPPEAFPLWIIIGVVAIVMIGVVLVAITFFMRRGKKD